MVLAYLLTWACYGTRLPGQPGTVQRKLNKRGAPLPDADAERERASKRIMVSGAYTLDAGDRTAVLESIREACRYRSWELIAAHVRTNHVHVVVASDCAPEKVMGTLKAYSSRAVEHEGRTWARHGSTRYLGTREAVNNAVRYVVCEQGEPMAVVGQDGQKE